MDNLEFQIFQILILISIQNYNLFWIVGTEIYTLQYLAKKLLHFAALG